MDKRGTIWILIAALLAVLTLERSSDLVEKAKKIMERIEENPQTIITKKESESIFMRLIEGIALKLLLVNHKNYYS